VDAQLVITVPGAQLIATRLGLTWIVVFAGYAYCSFTSRVRAHAEVPEAFSTGNRRWSSSCLLLLLLLASLRWLLLHLLFLGFAMVKAEFIIGMECTHRLITARNATSRQWCADQTERSFTVPMCTIHEWFFAHITHWRSIGHLLLLCRLGLLLSLGSGNSGLSRTDTLSWHRLSQDRQHSAMNTEKEPMTMKRDNILYGHNSSLLLLLNAIEMATRAV
jgi:hypothetical protein